MKKRPYYVANTGFFDHKVYICFSEESFQAALKDCKITTKHSALDLGVAESHIINQEGTQNTLLAIVFNIETMSKYDSLEKMGIIVHECVHTVTHVFQHVGEDETKIGDETRAYFTENLFKQVFSAYATEEDKRDNPRKRNRRALDQAGQKVKGALLQMAKHNNGSAGQDSGYEPASPVRGTEDGDRTGF